MKSTILIASVVLVSMHGHDLHGQQPKQRKIKLVSKSSNEFDLEHAKSVKTGHSEFDDAEPIIPMDQPFTLPKPKFHLPRSIMNIIMFSIKTDPNKSAELRDEYKNVYTDKKTLIEWLSLASTNAWNFEINRLEVEANAASRSGKIKIVMESFSMMPRFAKSMYSWRDYIRNGW